MTNEKYKVLKLLWDSIFALPVFLHTIYLFRRHKDLEGVLGKIVALDTGKKRDLNSDEQRRLARVSNWLTKLLMPLTEGRCLIRSLLLYRLIKQRGYEPEFFAGVRRREGELESHAWVELNGQCLEGTNDHIARHSYMVNVCSKSFKG